MDQSKETGVFASELSNDTEIPMPASIGGTEIRQLSDLELMIAGGGDGAIIW